MKHVRYNFIQLVEDTLRFFQQQPSGSFVYANSEEISFFHQPIPEPSIQTLPPLPQPVIQVEKKITPRQEEPPSPTEKNDGKGSSPHASKPTERPITDEVAVKPPVIPNVFQNLASGNAGASDLQPTKQTMCKHMVDGGDCKDKDAGAARNQVLNHVRYGRASPIKEEPIAAAEIKKTLQKIAPHLRLSDQVLDDTPAKRTASAWKEKIVGAEVVLVSFDPSTETLEFLKSLGKAIHTQLALCKIMSGTRLEQEKRWDLFLEKNDFRLIIASDGMHKHPDLMRHYKALPAQSQAFLGTIPVLNLSPVETYLQAPEQKALLWKKLCLMLKQ